MSVCHTSHDTYRAIPDAVNWSTLKEALKSGLHYQYNLTAPREETDAMRLGRAVHSATFEPDALLREYVVFEGGRRAGKEWEEFQAMHAGRTILKPEDYETALRIRDAVHAHKVARALLRTGQPECTLTWTDYETGLPCKSRLDWLSSKALIELKTTSDIDARVFGRVAGSMLYHAQLAFYHMGVQAQPKGKPRVCKIIAVESAPPHDVAVYALDDDMLWAGEEKVRAALELVAECRRTKRWPGRYPCELPLELPYWEFPKDEVELEGLTFATGGRG